MQRQSLLVVLVIAAMMAAVGHVSAQQIPVKAQIPFDFVAGDTRLPAGEYTLTPAANGAAVVLSSADWSQQVIMATHPADVANAPKQSTLLFHRYADQYFLSQIRIGGSTSAREIAMGSREREVARETELAKVPLLAKQ